TAGHARSRTTREPTSRALCCRPRWPPRAERSNRGTLRSAHCRSRRLPQRSKGVRAEARPRKWAWWAGRDQQSSGAGRTRTPPLRPFELPSWRGTARRRSHGEVHTGQPMIPARSCQVASRDRARPGQTAVGAKTRLAPRFGLVYTRPNAGKACAYESYRGKSARSLAEQDQYDLVEQNRGAAWVTAPALSATGPRGPHRGSV